ncbi:MAG: glycosyltransferase family 2 protein [Ignavibacterium sp.]|nr:MAG: glycosyltransferase family 2 protein [Ignavibacterium sp.]
MITLRNNNKIAAVIPFFNERSTINQIVQSTLNHVNTVVAIDDGSTDNSSENINLLENVILLKNDTNQGKGFALRRGLNYAVEKGFDKVITLDADLQHNPDEIPLLYSKLDEYPIVVGNRLKNLKGMPLHRRMSNKLTSYLLTIKTGQKILDSQSGFRAYRADVIKNVITTNNGYEAESEILINASRKGYRIGFADISTIYGNEMSKMNSVTSTIGFIKLLFS